MLTISILQLDAGMSEEEQVMRAIALSLGQDVKKEEEEKKEETKKEEEKEPKDDLSQVNKELLDEFSDILLPGCIELASSVSDSVYRVCDLLSALAKRNGGEWRSRALERVRNQVSWRTRAGKKETWHKCRVGISMRLNKSA